MAIVTIAPPDALKHVIKQFWYTTIQDNEYSKTYRILADGSSGIIFQHHNGNSSVLDEDNTSLPISFIYGQSTTPCINQIEEHSFIFGINLQPTALRSLFLINSSELTNSILNIEHLFPRQFQDQLLNTPKPEQVIRLFSKRLLQQIRSRYQQDNLIDKSIELIIQNTTEINSKILSSYFNISRRQFQRRFKEYIGVSTEDYLRIIKFQKSLHSIQNKQFAKLSDICYDLNYADQSHFNREFKSFSGYTPKEFLQTTATLQPFIQKNNLRSASFRIIKD
jgi:AraC-like DNA-binding protein